MADYMNEIAWRENIEWSNIWWEKANDVKLNRIALLGDSVTRAFRGKLNRRLEGRYVVDICASSSQITDSLLWKEYKFFFECNEWKYSKIFLHTGGQHGHGRQCCLDKEYCELFRKSYRAMVNSVYKYCSDISIISYTPTVEKDNLEELNDIRNRKLVARNEIVSDIAEEFSIPYIDIWNPLLIGGI
ncbi:MAG: hypothetical protein HDR03_14275 [Lachnospiraceae bacterium]|nr:hypothetical protein [Lachnospiraceae bacterium]